MLTTLYEHRKKAVTLLVALVAYAIGDFDTTSLQAFFLSVIENGEIILGSVLALGIEYFGERTIDLYDPPDE